MKKLTFLVIVVLFLTSFQLPAQNSTHKWTVGIEWNWEDFHTVQRDFPDQFKYTRWQGYKFPSAITVGRYLNPSFNLLGEFGLSKLELPSMAEPLVNQPLSSDKFWTGDIDLAYKFANGYILKEDCWFDPYIYLGAGASSIKDQGADKTTYFKGVGGLGINIWPLHWLGLNVQGAYDYVVAPKLNDATRPSYMHYTAGDRKSVV